jgi:FlaA1/EpsC-like NDP-sugar epimerase
LLNLRNRHFLLLDALLLLLTPAVALALRLDVRMRPDYVLPLVALTGLGLVIKIPVFYSFGLYNRYWRYASMDELVNIIVAALVSMLIIVSLFLGIQSLGLMGSSGFPRSVPFIDGLLTVVAVGGTRFATRVSQERRGRRPRQTGSKRVLVIGAGDTGSRVVRELRAQGRTNLVPVGFLDDDPAKRGVRIHGVPVLGSRAQLASAAGEHAIDQVVIAMPSASGKVIREIVQACQAAGLPSLTVPGLTELLTGQASVTSLRQVNIEDLLRREPVLVDQTAVRAMLAGKRVLITGAGGSIGSELCRQIARCAPSQLIALGHGEYSLFALANEFGRPGALARVQPQVVVADVRDRPRLEAIFQRYRPEIVFHAAAHKHVPMMEGNAEDAVTNNVLGTRQMVELAAAYDVARFVLISSDKAVNPVSIMGCTKRVAELLVTEAAQRAGRPYVSVRFGNVLGSRGSVVPLFRQQIAEGGPITVTHPDMQRYFMTIPEAVLLVQQAAVLGEPGTVFVLDMGEPVKMVDLANDLVQLSGLQVGRDIDIIFTGVRPGEKLFEELFGGVEAFDRTRHEKIFVARDGHAASGEQTLDQQVDKLVEAAQAGQPDQVRHWLGIIVPEFQPAEPLPGAEPDQPDALPVRLARPVETGD